MTDIRSGVLGNIIGAGIAAILLTVSAAVYMYVVYFHHGIQESEFIRRAEGAFAEGTDSVELSRLTDFDWTEVCFIDTYSITPYTPEDQRRIALGGRVDAARIAIPNAARSNFSSGLSFVNDGNVVRIFVFKGGSLSLKGIKPVAISVGGTPYDFLSEPPSERCISRPDAHLRATNVSSTCCGQRHVLILDNKER